MIQKHVLILGLGQYPNGSGISAALFFARQGAQVTVTDKKPAAMLGPNARRLRRLKNVKLVLGTHTGVSVKDIQVVVRNPGVPNNHPLLVAARKKGIAIESDITLFMKQCPAPIVGITGTRGKSTTSALVADMLKRSKKTVWLGGNMKVSPLTFLSRVKKTHLVVLELSSWMVETMEERKRAPHVGLITNLLTDHLNVYRNMKAYARAKEGLFAFQKKRDVGIFNRDQKETRAMGKRAPGQRWWWSTKRFAEENGAFAVGEKMVVRRDGKEQVIATRKGVRLQGEHNWVNAIAATSAAVAAGATVLGMRSALKSFGGLPDRQEEVAVKNKVRFINDTTATTPDGLMAALAAFGGKQKQIVLIAGGSDKQLPFTALAAPVKKHVRALVLLPGAGTDRLEKVLKKTRVPTVHAKDMKAAVRAAAAQARPGEVVLLSPACASFGLFKNEFDRGEQFRKAVRDL